MRKLLLVLVGLAVLPSCQPDATNDKVDQLIQSTNYGLWNTEISELKCEWVSGMTCIAGQCKVKPITTWTNVYFKAQRYERCNPEGCDGRPASVSYSGLYANIQSLDPNGYFLKIGSSMDAVEVVSIGTDVYVYNGQCRKVD